ncbi:ABC transporter permease [Alteromonas lipolytica]|uniref:ABC transporter ATP-binding protein n=1 Tax=Alteromonas lipolytica TaxID=1856405 RepID=A0A1E8FBH0_9ALTE|nr:ABC transporter permease [Alteromonas lipolytica]OFI33274.1 ABC transporter ATP-binding protein [Alteromonas lipolytica]GGF61096.1 ABC macrolide family export system permease 2 [Alteromonas lipolytica]
MFLHYIDLGWRSLRRTPTVSFLMVLAIALGIGITMTSLSVYHMMSMDPIEQKSDRLFHPQLQTMDDGNDTWSEDNLPFQLTYQDAQHLAQAPVGRYKAAMLRTGFTLHMENSDVRPFIQNARATHADFFNLFDLPFIYGSAWTQEQADDASPVVVISEALNDKLFGGRNSVGEQFFLDDTAFRVVGVVAPFTTHMKFYDVNNGAFRDHENLYIPFSLIAVMDIDTWGNSNGWKFENIRSMKDKRQSEIFWLQFWVQLDDDAAVKQYGEYLMGYMAEQQKSGRFNRENLQFGLRNVNDWLDYRNVVSEDNEVLVALSFMFLAVCLANILGLLLAKFMRRAPEVGVRRALGASKRQVFLQHIVEVSMLGLIGGLLGIALAQLGLWGVRLTQEYYSPLATMDMTMLLSAPVIAIAACVIAGMYPAWLVCRTTPATYLKTQ